MKLRLIENRGSAGRLGVPVREARRVPREISPTLAVMSLYFTINRICYQTFHILFLKQLSFWIRNSHTVFIKAPFSIDSKLSFNSVIYGAGNFWRATCDLYKGKGKQFAPHKHQSIGGS